jgi:excinuclease ABC subunit B
MGPGTDAVTPAGAISRSLFKKQTAAEAHGSDYGTPDDRGRSLSGRLTAARPDALQGAAEQESESGPQGNPSYFRKNSLDEMTVRRTEKPVPGTKPSKLPISPFVGEMAGRPEGGAKQRNASDDAKPVPRERAGIGSYEDPADQRRQSRRPGKTGRPGQ